MIKYIHICKKKKSVIIFRHSIYIGYEMNIGMRGMRIYVKINKNIHSKKKKKNVKYVM